MCHGLKGTSLGALQSECGELSLAIERRQHLLNFASKLMFVDNPALKDLLMTKQYPDLAITSQSVYANKIDELTSSFDIKDKIDRELPPLHPPWLRNLDCVDISLSYTSKPLKDIETSKSLCKRYLEKYSNHSEVFVDAGCIKVIK